MVSDYGAQRSKSLSEHTARGHASRDLCSDAHMPYYNQITGTDNREEGNWFVKLEDTGVPGGWRDW
jgi:hypothetical protein